MLEPGTKLGRYEIRLKLGKGGTIVRGEGIGNAIMITDYR